MPLWQKISRRNLAKLIDELSFEEVIAPEPEGGGFRLSLASGAEYRFTGRIGAWGHVFCDPASITRSDGEVPCPLRFILDARAEHGMTPATEAMFLRELSNTLRQDMALERRFGSMDAEALLSLTPNELHLALEGHPKALANKGRIGWGADDLAAYAPEEAKPFRLRWLAVHPDDCLTGESAEEGSEAEMLRRSLGEEEARALRDNAPDGFVLMPVHPWQWRNVVQQAHIADLATGRLVDLGEAGGRFLPTPSLRTVVNTDRPGAPDIKLSLSILNTSAWRGVPGKYITGGGALSDWMAGIVAADEFLAPRVKVLREHRGVWRRCPLAAERPDFPYRHHETLGAIWRDSAPEDTRLMAALLHRDASGAPLAAAHARRSGMEISTWLAALFDVTVVPLYHLLTRYGVGLIAHGQNISVRLKDDVPCGMAIKDFQGDLDLVNIDFPEMEGLPPALRALPPRKPPAYIIHDIQTAHFITVLRFLSARLEACGAIGEDQFYSILTGRLRAWMAARPEARERFEIFDLFTPEMPRVCINKVRFRIGYEDSAERPLPDVGTPLRNPLAKECVVMSESALLSG